jgi:large subunit ribosomal protein L13
MRTVVVNSETIERKWYVVDASDMILGRLASKVANILIGKSKTAYSPNQDHGDYVVVINSGKVILTSDKDERKVYFRHSTHPGGGKFRSFKEQMNLDSNKVISDAVHGMVPKNALGRKIMSKLHVYQDATHCHEAQQPQVMDLK